MNLLLLIKAEGLMRRVSQMLVMGDYDPPQLAKETGLPLLFVEHCRLAPVFADD